MISTKEISRGKLDEEKEGNRDLPEFFQQLYQLEMLLTELHDESGDTLQLRIGEREWLRTRPLHSAALDVLHHFTSAYW